MKYTLLTVMLLPALVFGYEVGDIADDFVLPDLNGETGALYDYLGDVVILNFFTTWCPGCNEEAEHLENDIWAAYAGRRVTVLAVDIEEQLPLVQGWAAALQVTYPILMAPDWTLTELFPGFIGLPYNAVLDRDMGIRYGSSGFDLGAVTGAIEEVLNGDQVPVETARWGAVKALFR